MGAGEHSPAVTKHFFFDCYQLRRFCCPPADCQVETSFHRFYFMYGVFTFVLFGFEQEK